MAGQSHFFAAPDDIRALCVAAEELCPLDYALAGRFDSRRVSRTATVLDIPRFGFAARGNHVLCERFIVSERGARMSMREAGYGGVGYVLDQVPNPDTIVLSPGGLWRDDVIIAGSVGSISDSAAAVRLLGRFRRLLRKRFERVRSYWVGPEAARYLSRGARLTTSVDSPPLYDLRR